MTLALAYKLDEARQRNVLRSLDPEECYPILLLFFLPLHGKPFLEILKTALGVFYSEVVNEALPGSSKSLTKPGEEESSGTISQATFLYNYRARYFDPSQGRFLQTDPLGYQDSMNLYQGMNMNPVNFVDPWGEYISIISNPKEIVWLLRFGVSESAWEYIDATKLDGQTIIDPVLISKYQGNDLNMVRLKAMAMDKSKITEIMTADEYKYINIKYPLDEMNPGYTYDSKNLNEIGNGGAFNRVQYGASLAVGVKVVTLAHELYVHAYLEAQGKEHRHFQGNVDNEEIKIEECAKINFNNFIKKWKYGKNVFNLKMYALAKKAREDYNRVNKNKMTDEQYEDVLRFNFRDYQKKKNEFYDFIIEKWDEYWRSFL